MVKQMNIKIDPEFQSLNRPLNKSEYSKLEKSIMVRGCDHPLVVWRGMLLDGHHRYEICQKHGIKFKTTEAPPYVKTREDAKRYIIIEGQLARRNLTNYQKCVLAMKLEPFIAKEAERRRREAGKLYGRGHPKKKVLLEKIKPIDTDKEVAKIAGISKSLVYEAKYVLDNASEKTLKRLNEGAITINRACSLARHDSLERFRKRQKKEERKREEKEKRERDRLLKKEGKMEVVDKRGGYGNWKYKEIRRINEKGEVEVEEKISDREFLRLERLWDRNVTSEILIAMESLMEASGSLELVIKHHGGVKSIVNAVAVEWYHGVLLYYPFLLKAYERFEKVWKKIQEEANSMEDAERLKLDERYLCHNDKEFVEFFFYGISRHPKIQWEKGKIDPYLKHSKND